MKKEIHPDYRAVVIQDVSSDFKVLTRSTVKTEQTIEWEDGNTYPLVRVEISSASHPFFTGKRQQIAERGGRIDQFRRRYGAGSVGDSGMVAAAEAGDETSEADGTDS